MRALGLRRVWVLGVLVGCGSSSDVPAETEGMSASADSTGASSLETTMSGGESTTENSATGGMSTTGATDATSTGMATEVVDSSGTDPSTSTDPGTTTDASTTTDPGTGSSSAASEDSGSSSTGADGDMDDDGIPDGDDPFPLDPDLPGTVLQSTIYAHTSSQLYTMDVEPPYAIAFVGNFSFPDGSPGSVTDVAIDQWGVLYAVTFDDLFVCNPNDAACYVLGALPESHNALTFVPPGTVDANDDALIGIANSGSWRHLQLDGNMVMMMQLGSYGMNYTSSGDSFSISGVGTYSSVNAPATFWDVIIEVDPLDGSALGEIATLTGYSSTYGLAGWEGAIFAFDESGDVLLVDPVSGMVELINQTNQTWWGAGVGTILPQ